MVKYKLARIGVPGFSIAPPTAAIFNRPLHERKADGDFEAHLVALSCSEPPPGHVRWSLRLLADKVVELQYVDSISYETVRRVLKKTRSSPGRKTDGSSRQRKTRSS